MTENQLNEANRIKAKIEECKQAISGLSYFRMKLGYKIIIKNDEKEVVFPNDLDGSWIASEFFKLWETHFHSELKNWQKQFEEI